MSALAFIVRPIADWVRAVARQEVEIAIRCSVTPEQSAERIRERLFVPAPGRAEAGAGQANRRGVDLLGPGGGRGVSAFTPEQEDRLRLIMREEIAGFRLASIAESYANAKPRWPNFSGEHTEAYREWRERLNLRRLREEQFLDAVMERLK